MDATSGINNELRFGRFPRATPPFLCDPWGRVPCWYTNAERDSMSRDSASQPATARGFTPRHAVAPTELFFAPRFPGVSLRFTPGWRRGGPTDLMNGA
jgi:hypothetical protein